LLDFVAMWGMILMPMGAVIFVDFWMLPRLGLRSNFAEVTGRTFNWAAGLTWLLSVAFSIVVVTVFGRDKLYFVSLPGWFVAVLLYALLSKVMQGGARATTPVAA